jgi:hypothetical protein
MWWDSYNGISVPFRWPWNWQCFLVSAYDSAYAEKQQHFNDDEKRRIQQDIADFLRYYECNLKIDPKGPPCRELKIIRDFVEHQVRSPNFTGTPRTNEEITSALRDAVFHGRVVPHIERNWAGFPRVLDRSYAPQRWPASTPVRASAYGDRPVGRFAKLDPSARSLDLLEIVRDGAVALGAYSTQDAGNGGASAANGFFSRLEPDDDSTPLGDAQPFEYSENSPLDDAIDIVARQGVSEADENDCFSAYEFDLAQCEFARAIFNDMRTLALCKERAFSKYQTCRGF